MLRPLFLALALSATSLLSHADIVLRIDVNDPVDSPNDTAPGFTPYRLTDETLSVPPFGITINPAGLVTIDDRRRTTPATTGTLTLGAIYRDCVFATNDNTTTFFRSGIDTEITGLTPGKRYTVTAWSFDSVSTSVRTSDWSMVGLGGPYFGMNDYNFDGAVLPINDSNYRIIMTALADESGRLLLRGRQSVAATNPRVFINGFTVDELPDTPLAPTPVLAIDANQRAAAGAQNTQAGFTEFLLDGAGAQLAATTRNFGGLSVTVTPVGGTIDDRFRNVPTNSGPFTESLLLRDFIFAPASAGMDIKVAGLAANQRYLVEFWSYDNGSAARTSDWTVNGVTLWDDYYFSGPVLPATNEDSKMVGAFTTDASGSLLISGRSVGTGPAVFFNALRVSQLTVPIPVDLGHPILSEFLASNSDGLLDEDGDASDWIEIWNTTTASLDLAGWRLTDNSALPARWVFPAGVVLPPQGRLVVFASGKNRTDNPARLHTNFSLERNVGSYLALAKPDGSLVTVFQNLPEQLENISYGLTGTAEPLTKGYFQTPTPGTANGSTVPGFVADTTFDIKRGYYNAPFNVHVACATPAAQIYYTTDGSVPTTGSTLYPGAAGIPIATTTVLRVRAFLAPLAPSNVDTQTYVFRAHVQNQPANPPGWPATWGTNSEVTGPVPADYEMDPAVVSTTLPGYGITDALAALPTLSIAMNPDDFHHATSGIYTNPQSIGDAWERASSFEVLELDGTGVATNCGVRIHGNSSRRPFRMQKHSFRIAFRDAYGDGRLSYKMFEDTTLKSFDRLVLHAAFTDGWGLVSWDQARYRPDDSVYIRDAWMRRSFAEMGHARVSSRHMHLYINGLYWGVYEASERVNGDWAADHYGGVPEDYDIQGDFTNLDTGTATAWNSLFTYINANDPAQPAVYQTIANQVDLVDFADYYLLHVHGDSEDWPHKNGYAFRNRNLAGAKWRFAVWDQEISLDALVNVERLSAGAGNTGTDRTAGRLYQRLRLSPEFCLLFADRAHKHLHNGGALSLAREQARWQALANTLDKAIVAESARWGDTADATPYGNAVPAGQVFTRENHWLPTINAVRDSHLPNLHDIFQAVSTINELRNNQLYPFTDPPEFSKFGGQVAPGYQLTMTAPFGDIYYTVDGSDPRLAFTGDPVGSVYFVPVALTQTCTVKARVLSGGEWSALTEATFVVGTPATAGNLAVTELSYNPPNAEHEFIELMNISNGPIDLTNAYFTGLTFTFPAGTILAAGERFVVVRNQTAFEALYGGGIRIAGQYGGALDNSGEEIAILTPDDVDILRFRYEPDGAWSSAAGDGVRTLVLRNPSLNPQVPTNWRSSATAIGTPGGGDSVPFAGNPTADADRDGLSALLEYTLGTSDTVVNASAGLVAAVETLNVGSSSARYLTLTVRVAPAADSATLVAELSPTLGASWDGSAASVAYMGETVDANGIVTRKWRAANPVGTARQFFRLKAAMP